MKNIIAFLALGFSLLTLAPAALAANADEGLYDPVAPKGSAFVRVYNAGADAFDVSTNGKKRDTVAGASLSPYYVQEKGAFKLAAGNVSTDATAEEGKYYTVVVKDGKANVLTDMALENRAKALVVFYNLTGTPDLALKTADGKVEVIPAQAAGATAGREMNGVKVTFGVFAGIESKASLKEAVLERGRAYAIVATQKADGTIDAQWFETATDTRK